MRHLSEGQDLGQELAERNGGFVRPIVISVVMIAVSLVSILVLSGIFSSTKTYEDTFKKLDEKKTTVLSLSAASAATSAALTMIPDDACTPIAEQLADISKDFVYVIAAILLEKYLLTILGFSFFTIIVPVSCLLFAAVQFMDLESPKAQLMRRASIKLFVFGLVLFLATPASVFVTSKIDETYADSINATIQNAEKTTEAIEGAAAETTRKNPENPLEFIQQRIEDLQSAAAGAIEGVTGAVDWVRGLLSSFIEAFAVMLVTSLVIPTLVPIVIYFTFKILFGQQQIVVVPAQDERRALPRHSK